MKNKFFLILMGALFLFPFVSSAHYITGYVDDALDGTPSNGQKVVVWNETNGINDNVTGTIGPAGESFTEKMYFVDCELLATPCKVGDELSVRVYDTGSGYVSISTVKVNVTGAGFDLVENLTLNSPLIFSSVVVDDALKIIPDEIDLIVSGSREVTCEAVVEDIDGGFFGSFSSELFDDVVSFYGDSDDNNYHYTNSSCSQNSSYGNENQTYVNCTQNLLYYSNSENWRCVIRGDDLSANSTGEDTTYVNPLLAIELNESIDYGIVNANNVSTESEMVIYNRGNVLIDLNLSGYGNSVGDGYSMFCSLGDNITLPYQKYNVSSSNPGDLDLSQFESAYTNLTSAPSTADFNLGYRQNDTIDDAFNSTFWRVYVPRHSGGNCSGNIIFGAVVSV